MDRKKETMTEDRLVTALLAEGSVRVFAVSGRELVSEAQRIHGLSRVATAALGRTLMMTALMAADLKNDTDRLSVVVKGGGPGGNLVCVGNAGLEVKGTVGDPTVELPLKANGKLDVGGYVGQAGELTVVRDLGLKEPYTGSSALVSGEIAEDFARYYAVSQQQPTIVYLGVRERSQTGAVRAGGGILVQPMPGCAEEILAELQSRTERIATLAKRLEEGETLTEALEAMFSGMGLSIIGERTPRYRCDCSRERIERALICVGAEELTDMIETDHGAELTCHFCNKVYRFSEAQLTELKWSALNKEEA